MPNNRNTPIDGFNTLSALTGNELILAMSSGTTINLTLDKAKDYILKLVDESEIITGGTYSNGTAEFTNKTGGTFTVTGFTNESLSDLGFEITSLPTAVINKDILLPNDSYVTYQSPLVINNGHTLTVPPTSIFTVVNEELGVIKTDVFVTGGTYSSGTATFVNNTGGTFSITGFKTNDLVVTGGTFTNGTATFTNNTGGTFSVSGFSNNEIFVTGGTYSSGTASFTNNTGGTFSVSGFSTGSTEYWISGSTGNNSIKANNDSGLDATGDYAVAEGAGTLASGYISHAEGSGTTAIGNYSHAEGYNTTAEGAYSHAEGSQTKATGSTSHAEGWRTISGGLYAHAEGRSTIASGEGSHSEGSETTTIGVYSHAEGYLTTAIGNNSHAEGSQTKASGSTSHAEGFLTTAGGVFSHAEGASTTTIGDGSHAEGRSTTAIGNTSHAEGRNATATGENSHAEGYYSITIGNNSHAEGENTTASGTSSHAEGYLTTAIGNNSHAEGHNTTASGTSSHSGGYLTKAIGDRSFVHGSESQALNNNTIVLGSSIIGSLSDTVYVNNLVINNITTGTSTSSLGIDTTGKVISGNTNISDALYTVNADLNANNTSTATTSVMIYGVNVFTGVTPTNYATKLPQPVTGKSVKVINNGTTLLHVFPSNIGGQVNNLPIDTPAVIPPDGNLYEFICIKNPLPGAWTFSAPATGQYDSGEISVSISAKTSGGNPWVTMIDSERYGMITSSFIGSWAYDGKNKAPKSTLPVYGALYTYDYALIFRPETPWKGIHKIKVYTNLITSLDEYGEEVGDGEIRLQAAGEYTIHTLDANSTAITNGYNNTNTLFRIYLDKKISGTASSGSTKYTSANIGDAGTLWTEAVAYTPGKQSNVSIGNDVEGTFIGNKSMGNILYPYDNPMYIGETVEDFYSSYLSFQFLPLAYTNYGVIPDLKVRFIIEYYQ